ncbi:MAG: hypothetical protein MUF49_23045 [Oculatellaceae cyanobacterium Prado106]|jgi:formamidopyrimidine-DNA glycosylase|nr:hypothetical protein [Oculatellaceae cyanobacterium Prado106]
MPEGPEVRRFADQLHSVLAHQPIAQLTARTQQAKRWLAAHEEALSDRTIQRVSTHGKNLLGWIEGEYYFHAHLMMWGRWLTFTGVPPEEVDRRERARIVTPTGGAILLSAPIFQLGQGNPYEQIETLRLLGCDILPQPGESFDVAQFQQRLFAPEQVQRSLGAALLEQSIVAGIGNYLRAEILFLCRLDPWKQVGDLTPSEFEQLCQMIPQIAQRAYETAGVTVLEGDRVRMQQDASLVYRLGSEFGSHHYVFRRTNLPCLRCATPIRQQKQQVNPDTKDEKTRIIYFCPVCQNTSIPLKTPRTKSRSTVKSSACFSSSCSN